jgi:hypothetical protein
MFLLFGFYALAFLSSCARLTDLTSRSSSSVQLGRLVPGTPCDYKLTNCSRRACVVRSPNYPGLYNRNLTCSHHIYVLPSEVPPGRVAVVSVGGDGAAGRLWLLGKGSMDFSIFKEK